jgi:GGDEF domain-containing protein
MGLSLLSPSSAMDTERPATPPEAELLDARRRGPLEAGDELPADTADTTTNPPSALSIPLDPATGLVTREYAEKVLAQMAADESVQGPITVALVELASIDWTDEHPNSVTDTRILCGVSNIVRQSLSDDHTVARFSDQQFLLLLPHEDVQQATRRAEEMRQRVATTEFVAEGRSYQTTVTCALTEADKQRPVPKLFEFLQEALDEAKRYGGNRTFMHDGSSPTPVVPAELSVAPQQLAI